MRSRYLGDRSAAWDVKQIREIVRNERRQVDYKSIAYDKIHLDVETNLMEDDDPYEETIVVYFEPLDLYIPLCPSKKIKKKNGEVSALVVPPELHLKAMLGDQCRLFYKIHHNLSVLEKYCKGLIKRIDYYERYPEHYIYNLSRIKIKIEMRITKNEGVYRVEMLKTLLQPITDSDLIRALAQAFQNVRQEIPIVSSVELVGDVPDSIPNYLEIE